LTTTPTSLTTGVWGTPSATCCYVPGKAATAWTFGCAAGVDAQSTVGANSWGFTTHVGAFDVSGATCGYPFGSCPSFVASAQEHTASRTHGLVDTRPITLSQPRSGRRAATRGQARIRAEVSL
jgi:hypothetical protein